MTTAELDTSVMQAAFAAQDYDTVIIEVRAAMDADPAAAMSDPVINEWLGKRFRNIFISEAAADPKAVKHSQAPFPISLADKRSDREKVATRMIRDFDRSELELDMPVAQSTLIENTTLVFAPGLLTGLLPTLAFQYVWPRAKERFGLRVLAVDAHPGRSSLANVADLENAIERGIGVDSDTNGTFITAADNPEPPGDVLLMGYSKGAPDILELLVQRPDLAPRIKGIIGWAGAVGGSFIADDIYKNFAKIPDVPGAPVAQTAAAIQGMLSRLVPLAALLRIDRRLDEYDVKHAVESLTTTYRDAFNTEHAQYLNSLGIPTFHMSGSTGFMEVPYFQRQGTIQLNEVDQNNDMQLTQAQASWPITYDAHLAMFHANHWDLSYETFRWYEAMGSGKLKNPFAREAAIFSIILFMTELGILK